jgi:all-trans-8'-apo-beta-carotenal 15,15'-oxygenase
MPFTAHPKYDAAAGVGYGYGIKRGMGLTLTVYRMEQDGTLTQLYALPQQRYWIINDMLLSSDHIIFVIPPLFVAIIRMIRGKIIGTKPTRADALRFSVREATRIVILRKDGTGGPMTVEQPPSMVFHHGNAFERDGKLVIDSCLSPDGAVLDELYGSKDHFPQRAAPQRLTRLVIDLAKGTVESRRDIAPSQEFPRYDVPRSGEDLRYLYTLDNSSGEDRYAFTALVRHDLHLGSSQRVEAGKSRALGEAVFVARPGPSDEDRGWLLMQGYDAVRDETFSEIRDAGTLEMEARVWTGQHLPLGFHGNFSGDSTVSF